MGQAERRVPSQSCTSRLPGDSFTGCSGCGFVLSSPPCHDDATTTTTQVSVEYIDTLRPAEIARVKEQEKKDALLRIEQSSYK